MKNLFILGRAGSGKTAIAVGLALKLKAIGYKVAYFKPVANLWDADEKKDEDMILMQHVLEMTQNPDDIAPYRAGPSYLSTFPHSEILDRLLSSYAQVAQNADIIIIGGASHPYILSTLGLDAATLAQRLNAAALYVIKIENDFSLDEAVFVNNYFTGQGVAMVGNIFNHVPRPLLAKTEGIYQQKLAAQGCQTLGIIPAQGDLAHPTVAECYEVLGGEILTGHDKTDLPVEDLVVGAMTMESALGYLRRAPNKAFITGGDRADLALAALETSTSVIILTGGLYPDVKVIARAFEKGIPILLVHYDTYTTVEKLAEVSRHIRPGDQKTINAAQENFNKYVKWQEIINQLK